MTTKELLAITDISEPTLRRWLRDGKPVPELLDAERDWRGWRIWEQRHVEAIQRYQERRKNEHSSNNGNNQMKLFKGRGPR